MREMPGLPGEGGRGTGGRRSQFPHVWIGPASGMSLAFAKCLLRAARATPTPLGPGAGDFDDDMLVL